MANRLRGEAPLKVGSRELVLVFDVNAMCEVEQLLDMPTERILLALVRSPPLNITRALLWGGLRRRHPECDLLAAGDLIEEMGGSAAALLAIGAALEASFPEPPKDGDEVGPRKGASGGTGRRSSNRGSRSGKTRKPSGEQRPA